MTEMYDVRREVFTRLVDKYANQEDLAEKLGISPGYISHLKTGYRPITEKTARKIEKKLNLPEGYLDNGESPGILPIDKDPSRAEIDRVIDIAIDEIRISGKPVNDETRDTLYHAAIMYSYNLKLTDEELRRHLSMMIK